MEREREGSEKKLYERGNETVKAKRRNKSENARWHV